MPTRLEPFAVRKQHAFELVGSPKVVQRWLYWSRHPVSERDAWLIIVREGGRGAETLIDYRSLKRAYQRWLGGEEVRLLPSEKGGARA